MYAYDKNGSHQKAIDKATDNWNEAKKTLQDKLSKYGVSYEVLSQHSKELTALMARIRINQKSIDKYKVAPLKLRQTQERLQTEFSNYQIDGNVKKSNDTNSEESLR